MNADPRIIEKIKKCLRLAASSNPHEGAAALRQAKAMMAKYGISEETLATSEQVVGAVDSKFKVRKMVLPVNLGLIMSIIVDIFEVYTTVGRRMHKNGRLKFVVEYYGDPGRVELAVYTHTVLERAVWSEWSKYSESGPAWARGQTARSAFMTGWLGNVSSKVEKIGPDNKNVEAAKRFAMEEVKKKTGLAIGTAKTGRHGSDLEAQIAGHDAARDFDIHRPVSQSRLKLEGPRK